MHIKLRTYFYILVLYQISKSSPQIPSFTSSLPTDGSYTINSDSSDTTCTLHVKPFRLTPPYSDLYEKVIHDNKASSILTLWDDNVTQVAIPLFNFFESCTFNVFILSGWPWNPDARLFNTYSGITLNYITFGNRYWRNAMYILIFVDGCDLNLHPDPIANQIIYLHFIACPLLDDDFNVTTFPQFYHCKRCNTKWKDLEEDATLFDEDDQYEEDYAELNYSYFGTSYASQVQNLDCLSRHGFLSRIVKSGENEQQVHVCLKDDFVIQRVGSLFNMTFNFDTLYEIEFEMNVSGAIYSSIYNNGFHLGLANNLYYMEDYVVNIVYCYVAKTSVFESYDGMVTMVSGAVWMLLLVAMVLSMVTMLAVGGVARRGSLEMRVFQILGIFFRQEGNREKVVFLSVLTVSLLLITTVYENQFTSSVIVPREEAPYRSVVDLMRAGYRVYVHQPISQFLDGGAAGLNEYEEETVRNLFRVRGHLDKFDKSKFVGIRFTEFNKSASAAKSPSRKIALWEISKYLV